MDDTQQSRASDAAATRKRRSSILKSQRPPRTPFSELEFTVATPTDTAKSRRVSFSRRTGVAEFITNEATTTWKNFYEEHNKSLESSGNESGANPPRPPIEHIGKRIFDQQFQEVEAVDFITTLDNHSSRNINTSMNNVNFTQQLASLECTRDENLAMPQQNFEMSAFTDHQSKLFGDDLAAPTMGEMSGRINVDFSAMQSILDVKDDLDEIQKDLQRAPSNVVCPGPFTGRKSMSEYIEVDLNATHVTIRNDDDNMSITDTIPSPKVQDVSKNCSSSQVGKKTSFTQDWVADKENIALNPYATPIEATNFAINDESDKILVFDGKRLTVHLDTQADMILNTSKDDFKPVPKETNPHQRKTIVLNVNDDLPNFVDDPMHTSMGVRGSASFKHSVMYDEDISITQPIVTQVTSMPEKNVTVFNESFNISLTQAISNVILPVNGRRRTIVDNCDISMTQALPAQIIGTDSERRTIFYENDTGNKSIIYEGGLGNISMTQALPANIIIPEICEQRTAIDQESILNVPAVTQPIVTKVASMPEKNVTVFNETCDISVTQAISNIILPASEKRKTFEVDRDTSLAQAVFNETGDIMLTQGISNVILPANEKRRTIVDNCDISMTQALPAQIIGTDPDKIIPERRRTTLFENDTGDISITQALPANIILPEIFENQKNMVDESIAVATQPIDTNVTSMAEKKITVFNETGDISLTQAISNVILAADERRRTIVDNCDISMTQALPAQIIGTDPDKIIPERRRTIINENDTGNISIIYEGGSGNISVTQGLPANIIVPEKCEKRKTIVHESIADIPSAQAVLVNVLIVNNATDTRQPIMNDTEVQNSFLGKPKVYVDDDTIVSHTLEAKEEPAKAEISEDEDNDTANEAKDDVLIKVKNDLSEPLAVIDKTPLALTDATKVTDKVDGVTSSDSLIYIIRDTESETQTEVDDKVKTLTWKSNVRRINSPLSIGYDEETDKGVTADLPKKIDELKTAVNNESSPSKNRHYENVLSPDIDKKSTRSDDENSAVKGKRKFKDANDTNELLEMLSDLTDKTQLNENGKPEEKLEEPRRLSVAPNRLSIVLSREDLLNNISMAQAALQRSIEIDESMEDTSSETPVEASMGAKKTVRVSNEVVKKLQFEDESNSEASIKCDLQSSLLKKNFKEDGQNTYVQDTASKGKVIPSYLKDVSDGIKALMHDLVKPNADVVHLQGNEKNLKREPSTCSTQIQANLVTSSQIDLDTELTSGTDSGYDLDKMSVPSFEKAQAIKSSNLCEVEKRQNPLELSFRPKRYSGSPPPQDRVIVFDHNNPLNNILLAPLNYSEVHRYNPTKSNDTLSVESQFLPSCKEKDSLEKSNTQFVGSVTVTRTMPSGDSVPDKSDAQSLLSNASKPVSVDESISVRVCELKDTKVNTVIAMKGNKELLEASSSLTLVDDTLAKNTFDVDLDMPTAQSSSTYTKPNSAVKVIYQNEDQITSKKLDSDFTSTDELIESSVTATSKGKKRNYSPTKRDKHNYSTVSALDVTPKPITKMQKLSSSPATYTASDYNTSLKNGSPRTQKLTAEKDDSSKSAEVEADRKRSPRKSKSPKTHKPGTKITVQQLITEYDIPDIDQDALSKQIMQALSNSDSSAPNTVSLTDVQCCEVKSPDVVSSFTSSKNQDGMREACSVTTTETETRTTSSRSKSIKIDWQPEITETTSNISECESSVNVVAKIDMLPFMGSHECEWEASGVDTWSFRLLHARLRLSMRLAHRHDNATRTRVRADTPVRAVALETAHRDKKNSVAQLCVGFACEAMRYLATQGVSVAGEVPGLLRRCAGVARVALRWGRAMHEARLHLAYTLANDRLALKVANIPLRSVWEVTMRLELVVEDAREVPWPRACDVRVTRVVSDVCVTDEEVDKLLAPLPRDWGHVPRTVWKIFRYLKNKTREDDLLGL